MNKKKSLYEAPTTDVLVVRFEGCLCVSDPNQTRSNSSSSGYDDDYNLGEI